MAEISDTRCYKNLLRATHEQAKNIAAIVFITENNDVRCLVEHSKDGDASERNRHACRKRVCPVFLL